MQFESASSTKYSDIVYALDILHKANPISMALEVPLVSVHPEQGVFHAYPQLLLPRKDGELGVHSFIIHYYSSQKARRCKTPFICSRGREELWKVLADCFGEEAVRSVFSRIPRYQTADLPEYLYKIPRYIAWKNGVASLDIGELLIRDKSGTK